MDDHTGHDLIALAPEVDMPAARTAFATRRTQARRRRRIGSAALASLVVLAGAGIWSALPDDDGATVDSGVATAPDEPAPTRPDPATEPDPTDFECQRPQGSSPATFDPAGGIYAAHIVAYDSGFLTFDMVQWLSGEDAVEAYRHDEPGSADGPPNDYYVVNESDQTRTAPVVAGATVRLLHMAGPGRTLDERANLALEPGSLAELPEYLATGYPETVYWLTVNVSSSRSGYVITGICEQYRP